MKSILFVISTILLLTHCTANNQSGKEPQATDGATTKQVEQPTRNNWMTFVGMLPCADCSGLRTELQLSTDTSYGQFKLTETYMDAPGGDKTFESHGVYVIVHGMKGNSGATVYQLNPNEPGKIQNYLLMNDSTLRMIDKELQMIDSPMNMDLKKQQ